MLVIHYFYENAKVYGSGEAERSATCVGAKVDWAASKAVDWHLAPGRPHVLGPLPLRMINLGPRGVALESSGMTDAPQSAWRGPLFGRQAWSVWRS